MQLILLLVFLVPAIIFTISQQNTLKAILPENRLMQPGLVWLQLIPLFSNIWQFFVVIKIARSIQRQLAWRHSDSIFGADAIVAEGGSRRPTQGIGIAYCAIEALIIFLNFTNLPRSEGGSQFVGLCGLATMTCWIIYWVQLARYKNKLKRSLALA